MSIQTRLQILSAARARIERGWCKGCEAQMDTGYPVSPWDTKAVRHCAFGAVLAAIPREMDGVFALANRVVKDLMAWRENCPIDGLGPVDNITDFNDAPQTTKADVLALFDAEIARQLSLEMA